ncbi:hypothetical protein SAY87_007065 [Trapa incisa]|uniref:Glutathione hydrolase n=1 Tax=Trapa incisa TaxID=236973 RepID=A0AAN7K3R7_9MYRT|nr:hypothetical protein SAY87_007065 [Trapa incisa]
MESPLLAGHDLANVAHTQRRRRNRWLTALCFFLAFVAVTFLGSVSRDLKIDVLRREIRHANGRVQANVAEMVESKKGVVAADDGRCSDIGASFLRQGGHAIDAAVATAICLGVVNPMSSGIGGGAFMIVRSASSSKAEAFDMRETAPLAASKDMYANNLNAKYSGALSMGVPGEVAGLHTAWVKYGRLPWRTLFEPSIKLAEGGFVVAPYLAKNIALFGDTIMTDPGLKKVFAPNGKLLRAGQTCYNEELGHSLEEIAENGPQAFYNGSVGERLVSDVKEAGGILTMQDLQNYKVEVSEAMSTDVMGYTVFGMQPPSSGTVGLSLVMNILNSYGDPNAAKGDLGLHRFVEALKHMFSLRMNLGDPKFVRVNEYVSKMLSPSFARQIKEEIFDNTTFPSSYYMYKWSQLEDHGTSHFSIVDSERNAVSMTTTVNYPFGSGVLSPSTGIVLNDEMGDFSSPTELSPDHLPPAPSNFIEPNKRPLSSMSPLIITKDNELAGVIGGSGGLNIIPAVAQVFLNYFVLGMDPLAAVQSPRIYHRLIPNVVLYENFTCIGGKRIEFSMERKLFLEERGHKLEATSGGAIVQLVVQDLPGSMKRNHTSFGRRIMEKLNNVGALRGTLTAVSDPRKNGKPAAV